MTIHGSKGLEFPVVHLLGMNKGSLPRSVSLPACLPRTAWSRRATATPRRCSGRTSRRSRSASSTWPFRAPGIGCFYMPRARLRTASVATCRPSSTGWAI
ncbi:3'-5' exonuclease [Komagataeibacter rhaeticus]|nr:3'-5' exonuclease [Komagataeibacter rhaeticus]